MAEVDLYLCDEETLVRLTKRLEFERVPIAGEWLDLEVGGLLTRKITDVVYQRNGAARVVLGITQDDDGKWELHPTPSDLRRDIAALKKDGWAVQSEVPNRRFQ